MLKVLGRALQIRLELRSGYVRVSAVLGQGKQVTPRFIDKLKSYTQGGRVGIFFTNEQSLLSTACHGSEEL